MKNPKIAEGLRWKVEWVKEGWEQVVKFLYILFNRIKINTGSIQWQLTTVKSIYEDEVKENIQENQRGIFQLNAVSKICESVWRTQNENNNRTCHQWKQHEENKIIT